MTSYVRSPRYQGCGVLLLLILAGLLAGSPTPSTAAAAQAPAAPSEPRFAATLRPLLLAKMREQQTPGAIVFVDAPGVGTWTTALGVSDLSTSAPMDAASHMRIGSITKTLTATAVLQLVDDGKLGLDDPVASYRPDVPNGANITIRQLLDMTSGVIDATNSLAFNYALDANPFRPWTEAQMLAIAFQYPPYFAPGTGYHYSNTNYELLGLIVEQLTGSSLPEVFRQRIFAPLGMTESSLPAPADNSIPLPHGRGYFYGTNVTAIEPLLAAESGHLQDTSIRLAPGTPPQDATDWTISYTWASGGAISTVQDLRIWAKALATGTLLSEATQRQRLAGSGPNPNYGLGVDRFKSIGGFIGHNGAVPGFQSFLGYLPARDATIVVLANSMIAPNIPLTDGSNAFPADALAAIIQQALFPQ